MVNTRNVEVGGRPSSAKSVYRRELHVATLECAAEKIARLLCRAHHDQFPRETQPPKLQTKELWRATGLLATSSATPICHLRPDQIQVGTTKGNHLYSTSAQGNAPPKTFPGRVESAGKVARMYPTRTVEFSCDYDVVAARQREPGRGEECAGMGKLAICTYRRHPKLSLWWCSPYKDLELPASLRHSLAPKAQASARAT